MENISKGIAASYSMRVLGHLEDKDQEAAVEIYENCTRAWRDQYTNPNLAVFAIGLEFVNQCQRSVESSGGSVSQYSENGNSSTVTPRGVDSLYTDRLVISDLDNHFTFITGKSLSRRCRI